MTRPSAERVLESHLENVRGESFELRAKAGPITLTCHPPQPGQAEARRSASDLRHGQKLSH